MQRLSWNGRLHKTILGNLLLLFLIGMTGCAKKTITNMSETQLPVIRVAVMTNNLDQWLAVIGKEKGFFEKNGIQLEISEYAAGIHTVDAIVTGQADLGVLADYAAINRLGNTQKDTNLRLVARLGSGKGNSLYVNPQTIGSLDDLAGQGVITLPGTVSDYWTAKTFEAAQIPKEQQKLLSVESSQAALAIMVSGEGAAVWAGGINAAKLTEAGMRPLLSMDELGLKTDQYYISSTDFLAAKPALAEAFLKAIQETQQWLSSHEEEGALILEKKVSIPKEQSLLNFKNYELVIDFEPSTVEHLNNIKNWAFRLGRFEENYKIEDFIDREALNKLP